MATIRNVAHLRPGDTIRNCGELKTVESISPGETGYWLSLGAALVFYRFGSLLIVVGESDAVDEAERIIDEVPA